MSTETFQRQVIVALVIFATVLWIWIWALSNKLNEAQKQRDEAYELARKAQQSAMYWYDVHEKMVWHTQPNEETK